MIQVIGGGGSKIYENVNGIRFLVSKTHSEEILPISNDMKKFNKTGLISTFEALRGLRGRLIAHGQDISISWFHDESGEFPEYANDPYDPVVTEIHLPLSKIKADIVFSPTDL